MTGPLMLFKNYLQNIFCQWELENDHVYTWKSGWSFIALITSCARLPLAGAWRHVNASQKPDMCWCWIPKCCPIHMFATPRPAFSRPAGNVASGDRTHVSGTLSGGRWLLQMIASASTGRLASCSYRWFVLCSRTPCPAPVTINNTSQCALHV